jgi:hypothetical protein
MITDGIISVFGYAGVEAGDVVLVPNSFRWDITE